MTNRTNWDALRGLKTAVGSLPPAENIDRAQVAVLGAAGPAAGTSVDLLPCPFCGCENPVELDNEPTEPPTLYRVWCPRCFGRSHWRHSPADAVKAWNRRPSDPAVSIISPAGPAAGASVDLDQLAAEIVERAEAYSLDGFALKGRNELRAYVAGRLRSLVTDLEIERYINAALNRQQERLIADSKEPAELKVAVRRWHAGAPSWNAEDDLYREMLQLAGIESGTPAGPPVAPAGAGLDVERLVEALAALIYQRDAEDTPLTRAFHTGVSLARLDGESLEAAMRIGLRALVLVALGIDPATTTRPQADPSEEAAGER